MRLFVKNIPFAATDMDILDRFQEFGPVDDIRVLRDMATGKSRGLAFVEMSDADALRAITALHYSEWGGRRIRIEEADPPPPRR